MRLVITRPEVDTVALANKLHAMGHETIVSPVMEIEACRGVSIAPRHYQAVAFSSANAARVLIALDIGCSLKGVRGFTVGTQSAEAAREAGFTDVSAAGGDVVQLATRMIASLDPSKGPVLYLSGAETAGDLKGVLEAKGFGVDRLVLYRAIPAAVIADKAAAAIADGQADGILLYSPRAARIWRSLIETSGLAAAAKPLRHYCLSANVAAALGSDYLSIVAARPEEESLLTLLDPAH